MAGYLFGGNTGVSSPQELERRRAIAEMLAGNALRAPKDVGEGLTAIGQALAFRMMDRRNRKDAEAGRAEGANAFASLFSGLGGVDTQAPEMAGNTAVSPSSLPAQDYPSQRVSQAFGASGGGDIESYIRSAATERGIDPDIAVAVAKSEGGLKDPFRQSDFVKNGVREQSYGPFQLYMGGGLGNKAMEAGIDPRKDWQGGINFALDQAAAGGWGPWYGAKKIGVTGMTGIGQRPTGQVASLDPMAGMPDAQMTSEQVLRSYAQSRPQLSPPVDPAMNGMAPPNPSRFAPDAQPVVPGIPGQQTMPLGPRAQPSGLAAAQPPQPAQMPPMGQPAPQPPMQVAQAGHGQFPPAPPPPQNNRVQQLMQVMSNPWLSDQERQVAGVMLEQEMKKLDPMRTLEMEKTRLELEAMRNPKPEYDFLTGRDGSIFRTNKTGQLEQVYGGKPEQPTDVREYEYAKQQGYEGTFTDWQIAQKRAGASQVNIDQKAEGAFDKKLAEKQAETFDAMATEGMAANADLAVIGELETLLGQNGGVTDGIAGWLAQRGIGGEGMSDLQAAQALINKLVPTQRQPGSGTMSDRDVELFTRSLPNLWNTPGGNQKILSVMRGLAQYKQQQGQIAQAVMTGEMTRQEATAKLRSLQNPLADFSKAPPKQGKAVIDGYIIEQVD